MSDADALLSLAESGVKKALASGATAAEVYVSASEATTLSVVGGYATPKESNDQGIAVRVAVGQRLGLSGASGQGEKTLDALVRRALDAAQRLPESTRFAGFAHPRDATRAPTSIPSGLSRADPARLDGIVQLASERFGAAADVTYSGATAHSWRSRFAVANSSGVRAWDQNAGEYLTLEARVESAHGVFSAADAAWAREPLAGAYDVADLADSLLARARSAAHGRKLASAVDEAILAPGPVSQLVNLFTPALSGRRALAKQTPLADKLGEPIAPEAFTLRDEPHGPSGVFHARVDHEGTPTQPSPLVDAGRVASFLHDASSAAQAGLPHATGHAWRTGVTGGVGIRPLNLVMNEGDRTLDELIGDAKRAVLVNEGLMGGFTGNEVTGDFSLVAPFAFLVENGKIVHALPPTTLGGNVHRMLRELRGVAKGGRAYSSGTYSAIRVGGLSCAT